MPSALCRASSRFAAPRNVATKRVAGCVVQVVRIADFEQAAVIHDADGVGEREGFLLVVGHQHGGDAQLALHRADGAAEFFTDLCIQRAERFVQQENLRFVRERTRHGHALLLAARKLARQALVHAFQRDELEQFLAAGAPVGGLHAPYAQREFDVVGHGHVAEQRIVLEHQADATIAGAHVRDVLAMQGDASVIDAGQAGDGPQQGALAAARRAQQDEELALAHLEGNVVDDGLFLISLGDLVEGDGHAA